MLDVNHSIRPVGRKSRRAHGAPLLLMSTRRIRALRARVNVQHVIVHMTIEAGEVASPRRGSNPARIHVV